MLALKFESRFVLIFLYILLKLCYIILNLTLFLTFLLLLNSMFLNFDSIMGFCYRCQYFFLI